MFDLGTDSLGRDLFGVLLQSLATSVVLGLTVAFAVAFFLVVALIWRTRKSYHSVFSALMLIDNIIPKYLLLLLFVTLFKQSGFIGFALILSMFFAVSSVTQLLSFLNASYSEELEMNHISSGLKNHVLVFYELFPLSKVLFFQNIAASFIQSMILESVLTYLGVGLEFGTPSLGFLLTDGIQSINRNPIEFTVSLIGIVFFSLLASRIINKDN